MKINIDLMHYLGQFVEDIGVQKPTILAKNTYAISNSVLLGFDGSNLPYTVLFGASAMPKTFYGNDPHSLDAAEHKAITSLVETLRKTYGIEIHDPSHYKIKSCEQKFFKVLSGMDHFVGKFNDFCATYESCTCDVEKIVVSAQTKYGELADAISLPIGDIVQHCRDEIEEFKHRLISIGHEKSENIIDAAATTTKDPLKAPAIVWTLSAKDTLSHILSYVDLDAAAYASRITANDLFIGSCELNIGKLYGAETTGNTMIEGGVKETPYEAENSAAAVAIGVLERKRGFEVIDFNYDRLRVKRNTLCSLVYHRSKLDAIFSGTNQSWASFIRAVEDFISTQYGLSQEIPLSDGASMEWTVKMACISDLENMISSIKQVQYVAVSNMSAIID